MLIDTSDLVSVTELGRGLSRYVNDAATSGRRFVILNSNTPTAALVSIADLERLNALDAPPSTEPNSLELDVQLDRPALADLEALPGYSVVGRDANGKTVHWSLTEHMYATGRPGAGLGQCFSAAIAGAVPDPDVPTEFVAATSDAYVSLRHSRLHPQIPIAVELDLRDPSRRQRFVEKLQAEIDHRRGLMRELRVETITELRQLGLAEMAAQVPNLVVVLTDSDGLAQGSDDLAGSDVTPVLAEVLSHGTELGIYLWFGTSHPVTGGGLTALKRAVASHISPRVVMGTTEEADQSLEMLGSDVATRAQVPVGTGRYRAGRRRGVQQFAVAAPTCEPGSDDLTASGTCQGWRPWLTQPLALGDIPEINPDTEPGLTFPIGVSNPPWEALTVSVNDETPHLCIVGGAPGSTTVLETLIGAALLRYPPAHCAFLVIDDDGRLAEVAGLVNVAGYARATDSDTVERMLGEALRIMDIRRSRFTADKLSSFEEYQASRSDDRTGDDPYGRLIVMIAGLESWLHTHPAAAIGAPATSAQLRNLLESGGRVGVHVVATARRSAGIPLRAQPFLSFPLRLGGTDAAEVSPANLRNLVRAIPVDQPGRCVDLRSGRHGRTAMPIPGTFQTDTVAAAAGLQSIAALGDPVLPLTVVPARVDGDEFWHEVAVRDLSKPVSEQREGRRPAADVQLPLGLDIAIGQVVDVPAQRSPHLVVVGSTGSGVSATLRALIESIRHRFSPDGRDGRPAAKVAVVDERGELAAECKQLNVDGYLLTGTPAVADGFGSWHEPRRVLAAVAAIVDARTPSPEAMPSVDALRDRNWYDGPEVFVLIGTPSLRDQDWVGDAVTIAEARSDLGVHVYLADTAGRFASKRLSHPLHRALSDAPTLLLSGPPDEGVIWAGSGIRFASRLPGRGQLVDPESLKSQIVQIPWYPIKRIPLRGDVAEARNAAGAAAVQAVLNGTSVQEAYQQQGIELPPVGTQLADPVAPTALRAGDVGMCTDHMVMALGNGKAVLYGKVQSIASVSSGPDFLGWFDPTKLLAAAAGTRPHVNATS